MSRMKRIKTKYRGVYYIMGQSLIGKPERVYYIRYRRDGREFEEKVGRRFQDEMTPSKAAKIRAQCIEGSRLPRNERRHQERTDNKTQKKFVSNGLDVIGNSIVKYNRSQDELENRDKKAEILSNVNAEKTRAAEHLDRDICSDIRKDAAPDELDRLEKKPGTLDSGPILGELKKRENDLESTGPDFFESEKVYKLLFEIANDGIAILDKDFRVINMNEAIERIYGWAREETLGKSVFDVGVIPPEQERPYSDSMKSSIAGQVIPDINEIEAIRKDGVKISVEVSNRIIRKNGEPMGFLNINRDITDRKRMEQALQASEEKARALLDATTDAVMLVDPEGRILDINQAYARTLGRHINELAGRKIWDLMPRDLEALKDYVDRVIRTGQTIRFEQEYRGVWKDNVIYPVIDIEKTVSRVAIFSHDITKRKKVEEELIQHRDHLEEVVKVRTLNLEQTNTALKVLLKRREEDKTELEDKMVLNIKELVLPYLDELKHSGLKENQKNLADVIEYNLNDIITPFVKKLSSQYHNLTATEIRIANLIKQGKSSKEIANQFNTSLRTIDTHRYRIRKKLGIKRKKTNLATYLLSIN